MSLRHLLADLRLFVAFFFALLGVGMVIHSGEDGRLLLGALVGGVGFTSLFLVWLSAKAGEQ